VETWDAIRARRNVRAYRPDPVTAGDLDRIAEAGRRAPSASNRQHWDFIVVTEPDQLRALSGVGYPADRPLRPIAKPDRRPASEVVHHGRW
jgi:nitroreductase